MSRIVITDRLVNLLRQMREHGFVTRRTQKLYSSLQFYLIIWDLRNKGVVTETGFYNGNKKWSLTEKGEKFLEMIECLKRIVEGEGES